LQGFDLIALDLETTGFEKDDKIIEIAMHKVRGGTIVDSFQSFLKIDKPIPAFITRLTGITEEMLENAPRWSNIRDDVLNFIGNYPLLAHNAPFDQGFLVRYEKELSTHHWLDSLFWTRLVFPTFPSHKLGDLTDHFKIEVSSRHRASQDAFACIEVFKKAVEALFRLPDSLYKEITLKIPERDKFFLESISSDRSNKGNNSKKVVAAETNAKDKNKRDFYKKFQEIMEEPSVFFSEEGLLAQKMSNYQIRPQQTEMSEKILQAFLSEQHCFVEAPTGVGKSLAYLYASLHQVFRSKKRIVIATNTLALQDQLFEVDIPLLEDTLGMDLPISILKGRGNYLCLRRLEELTREKRTKKDDRESLFYLRLKVALLETGTGDREKLNIFANEEVYWSKVSSNAEACLGVNCENHQNCFYQRARKKAEAGMLIVTNQSLIVQDLKSNFKLIPHYQYLIIDEAHNFYDEAVRQLTDSVDLLGFGKRTRSLFNRKKYEGLGKRLYLEGDENLRFNDLVGEFESCIKRNIKVAKKISDLLAKYIEETGTKQGELNFARVIYADSYWNSLNTLFAEWKKEITDAILLSSNLIRKIENMVDEQEEYFELIILNRYFEETLIIINSYLISKKSEDSINWLNYNMPHNLMINNSILEVGERIHDSLLEKKTVLFTSATLQVNGSFDFFAENLLLNKAEYLTLSLDTPFNHHKQSVLCIAKDITEKDVKGDRYHNLIARSVVRVAGVVNGGILVLFTSYALMQKTYETISSLDCPKDVLLHGKHGSRARLIEKMKKNRNLILFGTNSFWEGVDIKGEGLTVVFITRLPFEPPQRPLVEAKIDRLKERGENAFYSFSLPQAIVKFRQGAGRLIRSDRDRGAIVILDSRVARKKYGRNFLLSLPEQEVFFESMDDITNLLKYRDL